MKTYGEIHNELQVAKKHLARPVTLPDGWMWTDWEEAMDGAYLQAWIWAGPAWTEGVKRDGLVVTLQELEMNPSVKARLALSQDRIDLALMCLEDA